MAKINTIVVLTVDVQNILDTGKIKESIVFSDTRNDIEVPGDPNDYLAHVDTGKNITWCAIVKPSEHSSNYRVGVNSVSKKPRPEGGADILKHDTYRDKNGDGIVVGSVRRKKTKHVENYTISLIISKKVNGTYQEQPCELVDPKIQMHT